jgi:hypothetical protein
MCKNKVCMNGPKCEELNHLSTFVKTCNNNSILAWNVRNKIISGCSLVMASFTDPETKNVDPVRNCVWIGSDQAFLIHPCLSVPTKSVPTVSPTRKIAENRSDHRSDEQCNRSGINSKKFRSDGRSDGNFGGRRNTETGVFTAISKNRLDRSGFEPLTFGLPVGSLIRSASTLLIYFKCKWLLNA